MRGWRMLTGILVVTTATACSRGRTDLASPRPSGPMAPPAVPTRPSEPEAPPAQPSRSEQVAREVASDPVVRPAEPRTTGAPVERMFFDFDSDAVRPEARAALETLARWMQANPGARVLVEGHCDERGSDEYNLALGLRRANAVKRFLGDYGVAASRITVRSLGEERPLVAGHDESAWSQNRRAEFIIRAS